MHKLELTDKNQSWFSLAVIQLAALMTLPILAMSILVCLRYGASSALLSLIAGNVLIFFIRYALTKLSFDKRESTLDITKLFFGKVGATIIAIALLADTLAWFFVQTSITSSSLVSIAQLHQSAEISHLLQASILIGVVSTLCCIGGMKSLRYLALIAFPLMLGAFVWLIISSSFSIPNFSAKSISLKGMGLILAANLGLSADLPTFFRHRRSWKDAFLAIISIQIISFIVGVGAIFLTDMISTEDGVSSYNFLTKTTSQSISLVLFLFLSGTYANVYNVYSASVGWEIIAPKSLIGKKEYMIIGLSLTILYVLFSASFSLHGLLEVTDYMMVNLCLVIAWCFLDMMFLPTKMQISPRVNTFFYLFGWAGSSAINTFQNFYFHKPASFTVLTTLFIIILLLSLKQLFYRIKKAL